jgi:hypothetical protein
LIKIPDLIPMTDEDRRRAAACAAARWRRVEDILYNLILIGTFVLGIIVGHYAKW